MPEYLLTGRDPAGKSATRRVEAGSADDAVRIAREDLWLSDVVLHTDDASALYTRSSPAAGMISPHDYARWSGLPAPIARFLVVARAIYVRHRWLLLAVLGCFIAGRLRGAPWDWTDSVMAYLLTLPAVAAVSVQAPRGLAARYNRLVAAVSWGRWHEVVERTDELKGSKVPPEELAFQRAVALARLGRLQEALAVVAPFDDGDTIPEWLYHCRLSDVYVGARRFDDAHASLERAVELAPENATVLLDMAMFEIRRRRDARRARELLNRARKHALSDLLAPYAQATEGQIVREEGRPSEAVGLLEAAHRGLSAFRHASPILGVGLDLMEAELALALAAAGDPDAALRRARSALPRLRALDAADVLTRLHAALGPAVEG